MARAGLGIPSPTGRMGRHEPPTNRSYYLSVAASTLRFVIIVALAVGGILLINQAFPEAGDLTGSATDGGRGVEESPSPSPSESPSERPLPSPTITGTRIAVFNGAGVSGLAGDTQTALLDEYGYEAAQEPDDAPAPVDVTTIFYRTAKDKVEAEFLANDFFGDLDDVRVAKLQADAAEVDRQVQVAIYLGTDYADLVA